MTPRTPLGFCSGRQVARTGRDQLQPGTEHVRAGLINQQYALIAAIVFARAFGAELVLPKALHRRSFGDAEAAEWRSAPFASVWDEGHLVRYWAAQGVVLHRARLRPGCWSLR